MGPTNRHPFVVVAAALLAASSAGAQTFPSPQFNAGPGPTRAAVGDLNGDGIKDLAAMSFEGTLGTLLGTGGFHYGNLQQFSYGGTGADPTNLEVADFNGDGKADYATILGPFGALKCIPGNGMGGVLPETNLNAGSGAKSVRLTDLDLDGKIDAVYARGGFALVGTFKGTGAGPFGANVLFTTGGQASAVVVGDMNGDGRPDLVVSCEQVSSAVSILLGMPPTHGNLVFATHADFPVTGGPRDLALADFDNDGKLDVVVANWIGKSLGFLTGDGLGGLGAPTYANFPYQSLAVRTAELNGDAIKDVVLLSSGDHLTTMLGMGNGSFWPPITYTVAAAQSVCAADLDGNGRDDLEIPVHGAGPEGLVVYTTDTAGVIATPEIFTLTAPSTSVSDLAIGDVNGDGRPDAVVPSQNGAMPPFQNGTLQVLLGTAVGTFGPGTVVFTAPLFRVCLVDLNLDAQLDVVTTNFTQSKMTVLLGNGTGSFVPATTTTIAPSNPWDIGAADLDANGLPDFFIAGASSETVVLFFGDGAGGFTAQSTLASTGFPLEMHATDLNADGVLDLVVANNTNGLSVFLGIGSGSFAPAVPYLAGISQNGLCADDLDGDGDVDLGVASASNSVYVLKGDGTGALTGPTTYTFPSLTMPQGVRSCDVDADGLTDLLTDNLATGSVSVFRGLGGGVFGAIEHFSAGGAPRGMEIADVDADGRPDAVVNLQSKFSILRNQQPTPVGSALYGSGTPGCGGILGITPNIEPKVGAAAYGYQTTNAPRRALGLGIITDLPDFPGSDPFFLGISLHVGIFGASQLLAFDIRSDSAGTGFAPSPIPNTPFLVGSNFYVQTLWVEALASGWACSTSPFHLVTSAAVHIVVHQ